MPHTPGKWFADQSIVRKGEGSGKHIAQAYFTYDKNGLEATASENAERIVYCVNTVQLLEKLNEDVRPYTIERFKDLHGIWMFGVKIHGSTIVHLGHTVEDAIKKALCDCHGSPWCCGDPAEI